MIDSRLLGHYLNHRWPSLAISPAHARDRARRDMASPCGPTPNRPAGHTLGAPWKIPGYGTELRWCEDPRSVGLREVKRCKTKWYCSEDNLSGRTMQGIVYHLARGRGFIAGAIESDNDGVALEIDTLDSESDALARANRLAEMIAESEREYEEAWHAGIQAGNLETEARECNAAALQIFKERRALLATLARLERSIADLAAEKCSLRRQRDRIRDEIPREHVDAFTDGYSCA